MADYNSLTSPVYGGKFAPTVPAYINNLSLNTWDTVPFSNSLVSIDPNNNVNINPNYPLDAEWYSGGIGALMDAWCGAIYDPVTHTFYLPLQGGHGDYAGNEPYRSRLNVEAPSYEMIRNPSGAIGNILTTNDGQESTGKYADGRVRSIHSYNKICWVPNLGAVMPIIGNTAWLANGSNLGGVISMETGELIAQWGEDNPIGGIPNSATHSGSGTCYDPVRDCVWYRGAGTGRFNKINMSDYSSELVGASSAGSGYCALTYLEGWDCLLVAKNFDDTSSQLSIFDCVTGVRTPKTFSGSLVGTSSFGEGSQWHQVSSTECAMWDNSTNTTEVNKLVWTGDPRTATDFAVSQYPVSGGNSVVPTSRTGNGTYGRFFHDPDWGIFGVINEVNEDMYIYRYKDLT